MTPEERRLTEALLYLPTLYSSVTWRPYGLLFCDAQNPASMDANHAVILDPSADLNAALDDIVRYYRVRCMPPLLYSGYRPEEAKWLLPHLRSAHWRLKYVTASLYRRTKNILPQYNSGVCIEHPAFLTAESAALLTEGGGEWTLGITERLLRSPNAKAYAARAQDGRLAAWLMLLVFRGCGFVQDVFTLPAYRHQGLCTALISRAAEEFAREWNYPLYLCAENPNAVRIYERAGFTLYRVLSQPDWWAAPGE